MDKTRDEMNGNQRMLLGYLETLVVDNNVLIAIATYYGFLAFGKVPRDVYKAVNSMRESEITSVLQKLNERSKGKRDCY